MGVIEWGDANETWITAMVDSFTDPEKVYQVGIDPSTFAEYDCECPAFQYDPHDPCKHVELAWERLYEVEDG